MHHHRSSAHVTSAALASLITLASHAVAAAQAHPPEPDARAEHLRGRDVPVVTGEPADESETSRALEVEERGPSARAAEAHAQELLQPYQQSPGFLLHDSNYFGTMAAGRDRGRVKFQVSVRYELLNLGETRGYSWSFAYSQKAFWDLFKLADSAPFVENNYRPETFFAFRPSRRQYDEEYALGFMHESNGLGLTALGDNKEASKSWNQVYVSARYPLTRVLALRRVRYQLVGTLRAWVPVGVDAGERPELSPAQKKEQDRLMEQNLGYASLTLDLKFGSAWLYQKLTLARESRGLLRVVGKPRSAETSLYVPLPCRGWLQAALFMQLFAGKAERLMNYDRRTVSFYAGIGLL